MSAPAGLAALIACGVLPARAFAAVSLGGWTVGPPSNPSGYKCKDAAAQSDGIKLIKTKASNLDRAKLKFIGGGSELPDDPLLPFVFPVAAQIYASDGACWDAEFEQAATRKNDDGGYTGKTPAP